MSTPTYETGENYDSSRITYDGTVLIIARLRSHQLLSDGEGNPVVPVRGDDR